MELGKLFVRKVSIFLFLRAVGDSRFALLSHPLARLF